MCNRIMTAELKVEIKMETTGDVRQLLISHQVADTHQLREEHHESAASVLVSHAERLGCKKRKERRKKKNASANQTPQDAVNVPSAAGRKAVFPPHCSAAQGHMSKAVHCPCEVLLLM